MAIETKTDTYESLLETLKQSITATNPVNQVADMQDALRDAQSNIDLTINNNEQTRQKAQKKLDDKEALMEALMAQSTVIKNTRVDTAKQTQANTVATAEQNKSAINYYKDKVNSPKAMQTRNAAYQEYDKALADYQAAVADAEGSNWLVRAWKEGTTIEPARKRLQQAQSLLANKQQTVAAATTNLVNSMEVNGRIVNNTTAGLMARNQVNEDVAVAVFEDLSRKATITSDMLKDYSNAIGVESTRMSETLKKLAMLREEGLLTEQTTSTMITKLRALDYTKKAEEELEANKGNEKFLERQRVMFDDFLRFAGREEEIGSITYDSAILNNAVKDDPIIDMFHGFAGSTFLNDSSTKLILMKGLSGKLEGDDVEQYDVISNVVEQYNSMVQKDIEKLGQEALTNPETRKKVEMLEATLVRIGDPNDFNAITRIYQQMQDNISNDATDAIETGVLTFPDIISQVREGSPILQGLVPDDVLERMVNDPMYAKVDLSLMPKDPAGSVDNIISSISNGISVRASELASTSGRSRDELMAELKATAARDLALYYAEVTRISARGTGTPPPRHLILNGIDSKDGFGNIFQKSSLQKLNLSNAGDWRSLLDNQEKRTRLEQQRKLNPMSRSFVMGSAAGS